jgi:hypothetical protein
VLADAKHLHIPVENDTVQPTHEAGSCVFVVDDFLQKAFWTETNLFKFERSNQLQGCYRQE